MTYQDLLNHLEQLEDEQLNHLVMCQVDEEYYEASTVEIKDKNGSLEDGHPFIVVE